MLFKSILFVAVLGGVVSVPTYSIHIDINVHENDVHKLPQDQALSFWVDTTGEKLKDISKHVKHKVLGHQRDDSQVPIMHDLASTRKVISAYGLSAADLAKEMDAVSDAADQTKKYIIAASRDSLDSVKQVVSALERQSQLLAQAYANMKGSTRLTWENYLAVWRAYERMSDICGSVVANVATDAESVCAKSTLDDLIKGINSTKNSYVAYSKELQSNVLPSCDDLDYDDCPFDDMED